MTRSYSSQCRCTERQLLPKEQHMNVRKSIAIGACGLAVALTTVVRAEDAPPRIAPQPVQVGVEAITILGAPEGQEVAIVVGADEKSAYLGVAPAPMPDALYSQLDLPRGFGLLVEHVE